MHRLLLIGAGRMGQQVLDLAADEGFEVAAVVARHQAGSANTDRYISPDAFHGTADLVVDFSLPDGTRAALDWCLRKQVPLISGTTGLSDAQLEDFAAAGQHLPVLWSANFSLGINLCLELVKQTAKALPASVSVQITDRHHAGKKDAPSGTALSLGAACRPHPVEYASIREGDLVGEHQVQFTLADEMVEIRHRAQDRRIYARGALAAGRWLLGQPAGHYDMADFLKDGARQ